MPGKIAWSHVSHLLDARQGLLDSIVFTGGEACGQKALLPATGVGEEWAVICRWTVSQAHTVSLAEGVVLNGGCDSVGIRGVARCRILVLEGL